LQFGKTTIRAGLNLKNQFPLVATIVRVPKISPVSEPSLMNWNSNRDSSVVGAFPTFVNFVEAKIGSGFVTASGALGGCFLKNQADEVHVTMKTMMEITGRWVR
jgi:hypothetical protein